MNRRAFLASSAAASLLPSGKVAEGQGGGTTQREFYVMRKYSLSNGPQTKLAHAYFEGALLPALGRLGIGPVGVFNVTYGPETPEIHVLLSSVDVHKLVTADLELGKDKEFLEKAAPFWAAPASSPSFHRVDSTLMVAFEGYPKLTPPGKGPKVYQLRQYESPSEADHVRKVEMFHHGEFSFFAKAGCRQVFYADALVGERLPKLVYMLAFDDIDQLNAQWANFNSNPDWKKLSADQRYSYEPIVSNVTNMILSPTAYSQI